MVSCTSVNLPPNLAQFSSLLLLERGRGGVGGDGGGPESSYLPTPTLHSIAPVFIVYRPIYRPTVGRCISRYVHVYRSTVGRYIGPLSADLSVDYRPIVGRLSTDSRPIVDSRPIYRPMYWPICRPRPPFVHMIRYFKGWIASIQWFNSYSVDNCFIKCIALFTG